MGKVVARRSESSRRLGQDLTAENRALTDRRLPEIITVAWLTLGIASVVLAVIATLVLRSERESTDILHHLNLVALNLQDVLSDLADAENEERAYLLTGRASSLENFERSRKNLVWEFDRLTALVKNNPTERHKTERIRHLVQQDLDELQRSIASRSAAGSRAAFAEILTDRARKLTEDLRRSIKGIDEEDESTLARFARKRRVRLASAIAAMSGTLLLTGSYLLIGQVIIARGVSRRHRTEEALRASENRFETLCEQAPVGIYETDARGLCVYTNSRWSQMSGLSATESLGHGWKKALHPDDREAIFKGWKAAALQGASWEYRLLTPQRGIRWIRALGGPLYSTGGEITGYVGTTEDITEAKLAHRALEEREALNRAVLNSLPANIAVLTSDGTILAINEEWQRLATANGNPPACFLNTGCNYIEACKRAADRGSSDAEQAFAGMQQVLAGKMLSFRMQYPFHSTGGMKWFHMLITPLAGVPSGGLVVTHADITERRAAEERLRTSEERFRATFYQAAVGIAQTSIDGQWLLLNDRLCEILGYSRDELRGKTFIDITHPDDRDASLNAHRKLLAGEVASWSTEKRYIHKDGVTVWARTFVSSVRDQYNTQRYFIAVVEDITQQIQAQDKLRESEQRFRNMADAAPVMIWVSGPDKGCTFFNKVWLKFTGRTMEQELGQGWVEGVHANDLKRCIATYSASFDARRRFRMEYRLRRADGEYRWILDDGVPRFTPTGIFAGYIGSCVDITEKRQAEEERQKFVSLADRSMEFIGMWDLDFRPLYVNSAGTRLVGLDNLEAAYRTKVQDYFFPEDQGFITNEFFPQVLREGHGEIEIRFRHFKTGEAIWMLYNVFYIKDAAGQTVGFATVSRDITARKKIEDMLRQSEATTRALLETAAQAILAVDTAGSIVIANRMAGEMFGFGPGELLGKPLEVLIPERLRIHQITHRATFLSNPRTRPMGADLDLVGLRKDGSEFPIEVNLSSVRTAHGILAVSFVSDVTERKRTEQLREELQRERERLAEARGMERFRLSFDEAPVGMALIRGDGVWLHVNRALCKMTGYTDTELIARSHSITHPDDQVEDLRLLSRLLSGELASGRLEERYLHKLGHTVNVLLSVAAVERDEVGRPLHFVAHIQDLTEQKRVERELEASRAQMVTNARLSALGVMAGGVAHEINNPLAVIHASASNLLRMAESGSMQASTLLKNCDRIRQTADRISRIVRSLRHIAREGSADEFRETPVHDIVDETLELCAERFRAHNIRLTVPAFDPQVVIVCREAQICQALLNLLQNAFDELVDLEGDRWVELNVAFRPPGVVFSVSDSGPGIAPEIRARIMEPFFTTKPVGKGTGLGLSISRTIASEHGGALELDAESPYTRFLLKLPLSAGP